MAEAPSEKKVTETVEKAVGWLASEFKYFDELKSDLRDLQNALVKHSTKKRVFVRDIQQAIHDFYRAAKSERKLNRYLDRIGKFNLADEYTPSITDLNIELGGSVTDLQAKLTEAQKTLKAIEVRIGAEGHHLVKAASFYEGEVKAKLDALKADVDNFMTQWGEKEEWDLSKKELTQLEPFEEKIRARVSDLFTTISTTQRWITALSADLDKAKEIYRSFRFQQVVTPKTLTEQLKRFTSPEEKLKHLALFLKPKARAALPKPVISEAKSVFNNIIQRSKSWKFAAETYTQCEMPEEAKKFWKKEGDQQIKKSNVGPHPGYNYYEDIGTSSAIAAAEAYEKAGEWEKAGESWCRSYGEKKAVEAYQKIRGMHLDAYRTVGIHFMIMGRKAEKEILMGAGSHFFHAASRIFAKGNFKEEQGDALLEYITTVRNNRLAHVSLGDCQKILREVISLYTAANVGEKKLTRARTELRTIESQIAKAEELYQKGKERREADRRFWHATTEGGGDWTGDPPGGWGR